MRILVTGGNGQLGQELVRLRPDEHEIVGVGRAEMDVTNQELVYKVVREFHPDAIIHAAAYTQVDAAESNPDDAYAVNAMGTRNVAVAADACGAKMCYISTDYVFNGLGTSPHGEYDNPDPKCVYGKTKWAGEILTQSLSNKWFIVRTSWVFGAYGGNFVKTMIAKSKDSPTMRVVHDQIGSPTYTKDLADFLMQLVNTERYGVYHVSNSGTCSWYEFAREIFDLAAIATPLEPCTTAEFPRPAQRPMYSVLGQTALRVNQFSLLRPWQDALKDFLKEQNAT